MRKLSVTRNVPVLFFMAALVCSALLLLACPSETGGDANATLPLPGPRSIQATARDRMLMLQWTKIAPAQGVIPSYEVYYGTTANAGAATKWPAPIVSNASQLVQAEITGLTNHQTYYIWVKALYEGLGESTLTANPDTYSTPIPPPKTPGALAITPGEEMLQVTWDQVPDAFTYEVHYQAGGSGGTPPTDTAATMRTVSEPGVVILNLTDSTSYTVWVRAVNTAGNSPAYQTGNGTPQTASSPPTTAPNKPTLVPGNHKLTVTWNQVSGVPQYKLYYSTSADFAVATAVSSTIPANAPTVSAEITGLDNGTRYFVWVQSWNSKSTKDNSPKSDAADGTPLAKDPIDFSNLRFEIGTAAAEYIFAQDLPPSVFFPEGRPNTDRLTRVQETALGNLFTDGAAWYIRNKYPEEQIDLVFLNGGYIDNVLSQGTLTVGSISGIVQPDSRSDKFMLLTLTGAELKTFFNDDEGKKTNLEPGDVSGVVHTGRGGPHNTGFFGIVSKEVRYTLRYYRPPEGTEELESAASEPYLHGFIDTVNSLRINGQPIVDTQNYRICTTDYLAAGEYFSLLATAGKNKRLIDTPFWHGVVEYIYDQGSITPKLDGRIKVEGGVPLPAPWVPGDLIKP